MEEIKTVRGEITPRDIQVARWIARGKERNEVASILETSRSVINRHMVKMMRATGARNGTQAVATLMALGLLTASDVMSGSPQDRHRKAKRIAPDLSAPADVVVTPSDVRTYLLGQRVPRPDGEAEKHFNWCIEAMAESWSEGPLPIPSPRRDPDAPRPPRQPERDS
jgi:DNA-binding CsgD family transcriptional regulator